MSNVIEFMLNGEVMKVRDIRADTTLLNWLRLAQQQTGSKEGCAEGDCGACTILIRRPDDTTHAMQAVNGCILFMPMIEGCVITTVEGIASSTGALHPVQQAIIDHHGAQCGFCTPGFVVSLYWLWRQKGPFTSAVINDVLAGNLCRCTGYHPLVEAGKSLADKDMPDWEEERIKAEDDFLSQHAASKTLSLSHDGQRFFAPRTLEELTELYDQYPEAQILSGGTDIGLWVTKQHRDLPCIISTKSVSNLDKIKKQKTNWVIGAGVSHQKAMDEMGADMPALQEIWRRFGSMQVRASGTVCGNIANGSPIGDISPCFIALGAELRLSKKGGSRQIKLEDFFISYGKQDRASGEFVEAAIVPHLEENSYFKAHKISKRFDQDISSVLIAAWIKLKGDKIEACRFAFGGMAGIPTRARHTETLALSQNPKDIKPQALREALALDFTPFDDMRASSDYRLTAAANALWRMVQSPSQEMSASLAGEAIFRAVPSLQTEETA